MKTVKQDEFNAFIASIPSSEFSTGRDVGRTHGIVSYYESGKHVATERWAFGEGGNRYFTYEIAERTK